MACIIISVVKPTWLAEFKFINFLKVVIDKWGKLRALKRLKRRQTQLGGRAFKLALKYCHLAVDLVTVYRVMLLLSPAFPSSMKSKKHNGTHGGNRKFRHPVAKCSWSVNNMNGKPVMIYHGESRPYFIFLCSFRVSSHEAHWPFNDPRPIPEFRRVVKYLWRKPRFLLILKLSRDFHEREGH